MFRILCVVTLAVFLAGPAGAVEIDFTPLSLYLSRTPEKLGTGGVDILHEDSDKEKIYHPAGLVDENGILSAGYEKENVWTPTDEDWKGTEIGSSAKTLTGLIPLKNLPVLRDVALSFKLTEHDVDADAVYKPDGTAFGYSRGYETKTIAIGIRPFPMLGCGIGLEAYGKDGNDKGFWEVRFQPADAVSVGYRQYRREFQLDSYLYKDGHLATLPFDYSEDVREMRMRASMPDFLMAELAIEEHRPQNGEVKLRVDISKSLSVSYGKSDRVLDFDSDITVDGSFGGHNRTFVEQHSEGYGATIKTTSGTRYLLNIRRSSFEAEGAGKLVSNFALNFWESLLAGERFFNYGFNMKSTQYHIGVEKPATKRLTIRGGLQYIVAEPAGEVDHWTPYPFIKIGKIDEEIIELEYKKAELGVLALGFSYKFGSLELSYGIGQIIPLKLEKKKEVDGAVEETESPAGDGGWDWGDIWESIKESPGGNLQAMRLDWHF